MFPCKGSGLKPEGKSRHHQKFQVDFFITFYVCMILDLTVVCSSNQKFLKKIQNRISEKNGKKIVLLHGIWVQNFKVGFFPSNFWIEKNQGSGFSFNVLKNYHNLTMFRVILNFTQK